MNRRDVILDGQRVLQKITFEVKSNEPDGEYGDKEVTRYRTYELKDATDEQGNVGRVVSWELKEKVENKDEYMLVESGVLQNMTEIPVVYIYGKQTGFGMSEPPLKALADESILYYQTNSDYHHAAHIANVPMLFLMLLSYEKNRNHGKEFSVKKTSQVNKAWEIRANVC